MSSFPSTIGGRGHGPGLVTFDPHPSLTSRLDSIFDEGSWTGLETNNE